MKIKMNRSVKIILIAIVGVLIVVFAYKHFYANKKSAITLETVSVEEGEITETVTATGTIQPVDEVEVGTQVSGMVKKVYVDYNSTVKKGQLLAELDKTNLNESVANAQASYSAALNQLQYYEQNYNRQKNMYNSQVISKADFEQASYQLKDAKATVQQRKTALIQSQTNLGYANIYSPIDGIILSKDVEEGQTVAASLSTPTLFTIARNINQMQVEANVDEADIGNVKQGQRVTFTVDAYPELEFTGKVSQVRLGATTTSNVVTYTVIIDANNPEQKLKPGLTATITIYTTELKGILVLDMKAINFSPDTTLIAKYYQQQNINKKIPKIVTGTTNLKYVWQKNTDGSLSQKEITIGSKDGIKAEIISGLKKGDKVVYEIKEVQLGKQDGGSTEESPFMPKRPTKTTNKNNTTTAPK